MRCWDVDQCHGCVIVQHVPLWNFLCDRWIRLIEWLPSVHRQHIRGILCRCHSLDAHPRQSSVSGTFLAPAAIFTINLCLSSTATARYCFSTAGSLSARFVRCLRGIRAIGGSNSTRHHQFCSGRMYRTPGRRRHCSSVHFSTNPSRSRAQAGPICAHAPCSRWCVSRETPDQVGCCHLMGLHSFGHLDWNCAGHSIEYDREQGFASVLFQPATSSRLHSVDASSVWGQGCVHGFYFGTLHREHFVCGNTIYGVRLLFHSSAADHAHELLLFAGGGLFGL